MRTTVAALCAAVVASGVTAAVMADRPAPPHAAGPVVLEAIAAPGPAPIRTVIETVEVERVVEVPVERVVEVPVEVIRYVEVPVEVERIVEVPVVAPVTVRFFEDGSYRVIETGQGDCPPMIELLCNSEYWPQELHDFNDTVLVGLRGDY